MSLVTRNSLQLIFFLFLFFLCLPSTVFPTPPSKKNPKTFHSLKTTEISAESARSLAGLPKRSRPPLSALLTGYPEGSREGEEQPSLQASPARHTDRLLYSTPQPSPQPGQTAPRR